MDTRASSQWYEIRVQGHLDDRWIHRFAGLTIARTPDGETIIAGPVMDQAALYGILNHIRDLGLDLIAVQRQPDKLAKG